MSPLHYVGKFRPQKLSPPPIKSWICTCFSSNLKFQKHIYIFCRSEVATYLLTVRRHMFQSLVFVLRHRLCGFAIFASAIPTSAHPYVAYSPPPPSHPYSKTANPPKDDKSVMSNCVSAQKTANSPMTEMRHGHRFK